MWWVLYQDLGILVQRSKWEQRCPNLVRLSRKYKRSLSLYKIDDGGQNGSAVWWASADEGGCWIVGGLRLGRDPLIWNTSFLGTSICES